MGTSLTPDSYLKLNFIMVLVCWFQLHYSNLRTTFNQMYLIQNQWFSFILHTCFDSQNRWVKYKIMYSHNFCNRKYEKRIHKTGCWNIPAKFGFYLCWFGKHKHWIWTPDYIVSLYFGVGLPFISALCLRLSLHQGCERFISFIFLLFL